MRLWTRRSPWPDGPYCITTGWCNRPLEAIALFRRLEGTTTRLTGAVPRYDEQHAPAPWQTARQDDAGRG